MKNAIEILQKYWGYTSFRKPQAAIIHSVLENKDTVALLPTGGGKSICFQVPALIKEGVCIVISPLIALMQDQVENLQKRGIKASRIPPGSTQNDIITLFDNLKYGNYKFLYLSPERLQATFIQQKIKELTVNLIAIDEAHCISEWGHDFRPSYRLIKILRQLKPTTNIIALTASATQIVIDDMVQNLELNAPNIYKKSFFRDNLAYQILTTEDKLHQLKLILQKYQSVSIVYINSRKKTEEIANFLNANRFKCSFYHGGLSSAEKQVSFSNWMTEKTLIMVATNAFGMGIDKANVKTVIHLNLPSSIENYLQEAGRAGRNGKKAFSVVLQNNNDILLFKEQLEKSLPSVAEIKEIYKKLLLYYRISVGELIETPFGFNLLQFSEKHKLLPNKVDSVLKILHNNGIVSLSHQYNKKSTVKISANSSTILRYGTRKIQYFLSILLRNYGGLFEQETPINEFILAKKAGITSYQVVAFLEKLHKDELIEYKTASTDAEILFLHPREDNKTINRISKNVQKHINQKRKKAADLVHFIKNNNVCRNIQLLSYFNEKKPQKCGICDVCISQTKTNTKELSHKILQLLKINKEATSQEISACLHSNKEDILIHLRSLLSQQKIGINNQNKFYILL